MSSLTSCLIRNGTIKSTIDIINHLNDASLDPKTGALFLPPAKYSSSFLPTAGGEKWPAQGHRRLLDGHHTDSMIEVVIAPPAIFLLLAREHLRKEIEVASQNVFDKPNGAFTGEISAEQLKDSGISWTLAGHSERRVVLGEDSSVSGAFDVVIWYQTRIWRDGDWLTQPK